MNIEYKWRFIENFVETNVNVIVYLNLIQYIMKYMINDITFLKKIILRRSHIIIVA